MKKSRLVSTKRLRETLHAEVQKKSGKKICSSGKMHYICSAFHFVTEAIESPISMPAAFFMPLAVLYKFRPVWSVNAPTASVFQGGMQRGAELFSFPGNNQIY